MKRLQIVTILLLFLFNFLLADCAKDSIGTALIGQTKWIKIDVLRIEFPFGGGQDVTNIFPDGKVYYRGKANLKTFQMSTPEEFTKQAMKKIDNATVNELKKGSKIIIHEIDPGNDNVRIGITDEGKKKSSIILKFESKNWTMEQFNRLFKTALANTESEVGESTAKIEIGMTIDDVIKIKGNPKSRVNLGSKEILTYEDIKLIFQEGKMIDAQ